MEYYVIPERISSQVSEMMISKFHLAVKSYLPKFLLDVEPEFYVTTCLQELILQGVWIKGEYRYSQYTPEFSSTYFFFHKDGSPIDRYSIRTLDEEFWPLEQFEEFDNPESWFNLFRDTDREMGYKKWKLAAFLHRKIEEAMSDQRARFLSNPDEKKLSQSVLSLAIALLGKGHLNSLRIALDEIEEKS
jgi:hypothetical protein